MAKRKVRGCHGDAPGPLFYGYSIQTTTCPRRTLLENPWASQVVALWQHTEGKMGPDFDLRSAGMVEAVASISEGVSIAEAIRRARIEG